MRIDRLYVKNFKGFEDRSFDFLRPASAEAGNGSLHVIIGQNATGKTSILDALAVAVSCWFRSLRNVKRRLVTESDVRLKVMDFGDTQRIERIYPSSVRVNGAVFGTGMKWTVGKVGPRIGTADADELGDSAKEAMRRMQDGAEVTLPMIAYYGTGRLWLTSKVQEPNGSISARTARRLLDALMGEEDPSAARVRSTKNTISPATAARLLDKLEKERELSESFDSRLDGYRGSIEPHCNPRDLLQWLKLEQQLTVQDGRESTQFKVVKNAIRHAVEDCESVEYHLRLGLLLKFREHPQLPFGSLSDGQRNMVALIGDIAHRAAQLNPNLGTDVLSQTPGIVLIDEVDLHLHPLWQQHVLEDLRRIFPQVQFFVTTHSPFIVQTAREGEVVKLDGVVAVEPAARSIEEIAHLVMDVGQLAQSPRYAEMQEVARKYLSLAEQASHAPTPEKEAIREQLVALLAPYSDNPAYRALLERKGIAAMTG